MRLKRLHKWTLEAHACRVRTTKERETTMITKETITVVKTVDIDHGTRVRFLPGDQRFILWYGIAIGKLAPVPSTTGRVTEVCHGERSWMLKTPVRIEQIDALLDEVERVDKDILAGVADPEDCLYVANPWCPKGLEDTWRESARRRREERRTW